MATPQNDSQFFDEVKRIAYSVQRYTNQAAYITQVRSLYSAYRKTRPASQKTDYPAWPASRKMPGWIAEHYYAALHRRMESDDYKHGRGEVKNPRVSKLPTGKKIKVNWIKQNRDGSITMSVKGKVNVPQKWTPKTARAKRGGTFGT